MDFPCRTSLLRFSALFAVAFPRFPLQNFFPLRFFAVPSCAQSVIGLSTLCSFTEFCSVSTSAGFFPVSSLVGTEIFRELLQWCFSLHYFKEISSAVFRRGFSNVLIAGTSPMRSFTVAMSFCVHFVAGSFPLRVFTRVCCVSTDVQVRDLICTVFSVLFFTGALCLRSFAVQFLLRYFVVAPSCATLMWFYPCNV